MISAPVVPGYEVYDAIGQGGFGTVYRARQLTVGREVALKIDNRVLTTERDRRRFLREVSAAGHLSGHPHVIGLYDAGTLPDGRPYLVMELCPGGSLESVLHQRGHLPFEQVRDIGVGIADALAAAHDAGVLHRDLKPANILVNRYGVVGLSDFGLASILDADGAQSATREALTPAYAAPEAFELADPAPAADVYSLAATLYALLSGLPPRFPPGARPGIATIMRLHHAPVPDIVGVPRELVDVLRAGLVTDPARRLGSASALRDALAAVRLDDAPVAAPAAGAAAPLWAPAAPGVPAAAPVAAPAIPVAEPTVTAAGPGTRQLPQPAPGALTFPLQPTVANLPPGHPSGGDYGAPAPAASTPGWAPASPAPDARPRRSRRRTTLLVVAVLALLVAAATATWTVIGRGGSPSASPGGTATGATNAPPPGQSGSSGTPAGSPQVAGHPVVACAATADIPGTGCPVTPECWGGTVNINGMMSASMVDCAAPHSWETFAIGPMPAEVIAGGEPNQQLVIVSAQAKRLCSTAVLTRGMSAAARRIPVKAWEIDVLTPSQHRFDVGDHAFRCIATVTAMSSRGSAFSPTATSYATQTPSY